ncbi:hypothetical protein L1276_000719 [Flavobacterium sp. HSC-32F16]|uniref:hypothetical protein n=1 Tax=Flavobacterium sp. HSC-32F16 TaxID=2910964 RepID=UPI0020A3D53E|nr:hypothetical protein [Flavobacterium sp. HSC-32F16]MCP2025579.1 hypothetical protein [Flavobacterium sp. HSC-32F16]
MKKKLKLLPFLFFILFFTSCDPAQELRFVNKTNSDATVRILLKPNAKNFRLEEAADKGSIVFNLKKDSTAYIYYGIGVWSGKDIFDFSNSAKYIEIDTKDIKTVYKSEKAMQDILSDNVKGILVKNLIEIDIK